jgi:uncharacterized protein (DUF58 family)
VTPRRLLLVGLVLGGAALSASGLVLLGLLAVLADALATLWTRHGMDRLTYVRTIAQPRAVWGDTVEVDLTVRNAKALPIPWFRVDDFATEELTVADAPLVPSERPGLGILRSTWTMGPFERATRRVHVVADRRGRFELGPTRLTIADVFGRDARSVEVDERGSILVRPRSVPVEATHAWRASAGTLRSRALSVSEDPSLFAGVRPFRRGDARRRIHQRATARTGVPLSKRFDPSTPRTAVVALDLKTHGGPGWLLAYDAEVLESIVVATASVARDLLVSGAAVGIAANGWSRSLSRTAFLAPRPGLHHLSAIGDLLARLSLTSSIGFDRLLAGLPARLPSGSILVLVTAQDPASIVPTVRRLAAAGHEIRFVAVGPEARAHARRLSAAGFVAAEARLASGWRTSRVLELLS